MSRDWKPGDVAVAEVHGVEGVRVFRRQGPCDGDWAYSPDAGRGIEYSCSSDGEGLVKNPRPLVVIDPESWDSVGELREALFGLSSDAQSIPEMQASLREFANPTPTIEEPKNWLACVVDEEGVRWARESEADYPWITEQGERTDNWKNLGPTVVRVLSEGIS